MHARSGRHSARINAPNADALLMPIKTAADGNFSAGRGHGRYRVRFAARSSPAGVAAGALFAQYAPHGSKMQGPPLDPPRAAQTTLTTQWQVIDVTVDVAPVPDCAATNVSCAKIPLQLWARSPFATGAFVGIDDVSVVFVP